MFDGDVFVAEDWRLGDEVLHADLLQTKFSAYLYWRQHGFGGGVRGEVFATSVVEAADGGLLMARSVAGTLNSGQYLSPGGLFDARDMGPGGMIDVAGAAARELAEETGLDGSDVVRRPGYLVACVAPYLAIASVFGSHLDGCRLLERVNRHLAAQAAPELEAPCIITGRDELESLPTTRFTRLLSEAHLA